MSGVSLATKGMICHGGLTGGGTYGRPSSEPIIDVPIIRVRKVKTKIINPHIDLAEMANISVKVDRVISSH